MFLGYNYRIMLKCLAIVAIAFASVSLLPAQATPQGPPRQGVAEPHHSESGRQQPDASAAQQSPPERMMPSVQPTAPACDEVCQQGHQNLAIQGKIEFFTGVLALVGALQGLVFFLTWKTIARQTNLQEFLTRQWVDVGNFHVGWEDPRMDPVWDTEKARERPGKTENLRNSLELHFSFDILNNTHAPLTLTRVSVKVSKGAKGMEWETHEYVANVILPPIRPAGDNAYTCGFALMLDAKQVRLYAATCFGMQLEISATFLNADGKEVTQKFHRWGLGGIRAFGFDNEQSWAKEIKQESDEEKAN
jgi:hypothetical protein